MSADVHALTGAYVADAVSPEERRAFERHLAGCAVCALEVAEFREVLTRLGLATASAPPAGLRAGVLTLIGTTHQDGTSIGVRGRRPRAAHLIVSAAAVMLAITATLGVQLVREHQQLADSRERTAAATPILHADDTAITQENLAGARLTVLVSHDRDTLLVRAEALRPAPPGHDYQVWVGDTELRSAGLLVPDHGHADLEIHDIDATIRLTVTVEPLGGSPHPTTPWMATVVVP